MEYRHTTTTNSSDITTLHDHPTSISLKDCGGKSCEIVEPKCQENNIHLKLDSTETGDADETTGCSKDEIHSMCPDDEPGLDELKELKIEEHHDEDEVRARLFAKPDLSDLKSITNDVGSSLWGWVSSTGTALATTAQSVAKESGLDKLTDAAKELGERKRLELMKQVEYFVESSNGNDEGMLPWDEPTNLEFADAIKERVLELSKDEQTFIIPPPDVVKFCFDFEKWASNCAAMSAADPQLVEMFSKLVPKRISAETFWHNYFYRVSLIKDAYQISSHVGSDIISNESADRQIGHASRNIRVDAGDTNAKTNKGDSPNELHCETKNKISKWDDDLDGMSRVRDDTDSPINSLEMMDDFELLASTGLHLDNDIEDSDDEDFEARIKAELDLD